MKVNFTSMCVSVFLLAVFLFATAPVQAQCITTTEPRENITTNATLIAGTKTETISSNNINIAYKNQGNGSKLTIKFAGNNNIYRNDTIRFVGDMTIENLTRGNNAFNNLVLVVTANSTIVFKSLDINNSSNITFINYGIMQFDNSITMAANTIFINKNAAAVLTFKQFTNFANNSNTTVLYSNGGIVNFNGFQLQGNNRMCLTGNTQVNTTSVGNDVTNGIYVPASFSACLKYTTNATLNNKIFSGPGTLNVAQNPGAANASNGSNWGTSMVRANSGACNLILPVTLKAFDVVYNQQSVTANWSTATELNFSGFEIERSLDGINFRTIGALKAKGNSNNIVHYSFKDGVMVQALTYFYRLKMIDADGTYTYSAVRSVDITGNAGKATAFASGNEIFVKHAAANSKTTIALYDVVGKLLFWQRLAEGQTNTTIHAQQLAHGNYIIVLAGSGKKETIQVVR
ncbi:T9SS type A sorting domain-containing protein [Panacibacter sp. DH6]|uniref:T9SS type A sorting domain-containing protein n=1 Tax=Panacibacter microcysteis TaxID=2793269 RepID=A0A931E8Y9_9BACT|nr:T9SS type A sorting domain-containing protein [Panacibacter microcysteis]MBG9377495.1 T9SS type A sorting domain-containing protein [Panacibacter microcysteis]